MYTANEIRTWESAGKTSQPSASPTFLEKSKLIKKEKRQKIYQILIQKIIIT
jgi:hypothetical protein